MLYGWLLDKNSDGSEPLANFPYPVVLLQGGKSGSDCFIESFCSDLYGVLNVSDILYRNCARSENHRQNRSIFAFYSPRETASVSIGGPGSPVVPDWIPPMACMYPLLLSKSA